MRSYSQDLRDKVIQYTQQGHSQRSAAERFQVSKSAVQRWVERLRKTGNYNAYIRHSPPRRIDPKALENKIEEVGYVDTEVLAAHFKASKTAIYMRLKQLGYTFKKKAIPMWKPPQKNRYLSRQN